MEQYELYFLNKFDSGEKFTIDELSEMRCDYQEITTTYGENRRWLRSAETIFKVGERYFCLPWEEGLTESQENEYYNQPYEVYPLEQTRVITTTLWNKKDEQALGLIIKEENNLSLNHEISQKIANFEKQAKLIKEAEDKLKLEILVEMEKNNIKKLETDDLIVTYYEESYSETFDSKALKADNTELYNKYIKISPKKSYIKIKVK